MTISEFESWIYSVVPTPTSCITCSLFEGLMYDMKGESEVAKKFGRPHRGTLWQHPIRWDITPRAGFAYQLTEKLLLLGVHPEKFAQHKRVKGRFSYHCNCGLEIENFCVGISQKDLIQIAMELMEEIAVIH